MFLAPNSSIFLSTSSMFVLSSSPSKTFSITTGSNPFKSWKTRVHFKIIFYSNINESGKMVNCDIFRSHFILGVFNYNVLILNILS